jgi:catechol 2,3-dioxygenase-like lactoylglutathione lyase family enzyme
MKLGSVELGFTRRSYMSGEEVGSDTVDLKLEVVVIPVSDVERAWEFYGRLGWRVDANVNRDGFRLVQLTPPGSGCSIQFGTDLTTAVPGSVKDVYLVVSDIDAARKDLSNHGVAVSEAFHEKSLGGRFHEAGADDRIEGRSPDSTSYGSFATFSDPDGNTWLLQEITTRLPGRVKSDTTYASVPDLAGALRRASAAHGDHEKRIGHADADWPDWYAAYMVAEEAGSDLPT